MGTKTVKWNSSEKILHSNLYKSPLNQDSSYSAAQSKVQVEFCFLLQECMEGKLVFFPCRITKDCSICTAVCPLCFKVEGKGGAEFQGLAKKKPLNCSMWIFFTPKLKHHAYEVLLQCLYGAGAVVPTSPVMSYTQGHVFSKRSAKCIMGDGVPSDAALERRKGSPR